MDTECLNIIVSVVLGVIQIVLTVVIFNLSKKISFKAKLDNRNQIKPKLDEIINNIYVKKNRKHSVVLIDVDVYEKYYPSNENPFGRYSHFKAEIKNTRFDGVEFFWGSEKLYFDEDKETFSKNGKSGLIEYEAFNVGIIPYDWIVDVDLQGDEYNGTMIYCKFKNKSFWKIKRVVLVKMIHKNNFKNRNYLRLEKNRNPFKRCVYCVENKWFDETTMPFEAKYTEIEISKR